jgi:hypothetical protein
MPRSLDRRSFLQHSCLFGGSLLTCSIPLDRTANAAPVRIEAPVVDEVTIKEVTDSALRNHAGISSTSDLHHRYTPTISS